MRINIVTGMNTNEINRISKTLNWNGKLYFPETFKHPKQICERILLDLKGYDEVYHLSNIVIETFSSDVINMFGALIHQGYLDNNDVKVYIIVNNEIKKLSYDEDGYLDDFPIGYFSYDLENAIKNIKAEVNK